MEVSPEPMTKSAVVRVAGGKKQACMRAFDLLLQEGYLAVHEQRSKGSLFAFVKPFVEADDQLAQHQRCGEPFPMLRSVPNVVLGSGS